MGFTDILGKSTLADYGKKIRSAPREVVFSRTLLLSAMMYATAAIPLSELSQLRCFAASLTQYSMGSRLRIDCFLSLKL